MSQHPDNHVGATHWGAMPDGGILFYKISEAEILLWAPFSKVWMSPGIVPYTLHCFDDEENNLSVLIAQRDELLAALMASREACKMVLSERHRLSDSTSDAVVSGINMADQAIAKAVQP
jgi:hypothetical protein